MRTTIYSVIKNLTLLAGLTTLMTGCVSVPEQVQLSHNGKPAQSCEVADSEPSMSLALNGSSFSLTSWNIYKGKLSGWDQDLAQLHEQSDLLLLQEAHLKPEMQNWLNRNALDWAMANAFEISGSWSGVMTAGKVPLQAPCAQRIHEPYLRLPKTALLSYHPIAGQTESLLVANIHGVNFTLGKSDLAAQFQAITEVIDTHQGPVIVAGDFNTWSKARMQVVKQLTDSRGLQAVTFDSNQPAIHFGSQVDHIYYRGLTPLQSRVTELKSSDHYPLTVTFSLDPEA